VNIALLPSSFAPHIGGVEEMTAGLARELQKRGHNVLVVAPLWPQTLPESEVIGGIQVRRQEYPAPAKDWQALLRFLRRAPAALKTLTQALNRFGANVINVHCLGPNALYGRWAARRLNLPLVASTHGEFQGDDTSAAKSAFSRWTRRTCIEAAGCVTACSQYTLNNIPFAIRCEAIVIPNAVDLAEADRQEGMIEPGFIFTAARLSYTKGIDLLIKPFAKCQLAVDARLWIAGDGPQRGELEDLARSAGLDDRCAFLGALPRNEVARLMGSCTFYVSPSREEGFGISNLEAMAAGKAVLATRVGGVPEVVLDGETGILVLPEDVDALAEGIRRLADDPALRERLGAAGRERARLFSWDAVTERYLEVYGKVCGEGKEPGSVG